MQPFRSPEEAHRAFLSLLLEQAAQEGIEFNDLERRLLSSTETSDSVSETEWEHLNENLDLEEALDEKIAALTKRLRRKIAKTEGIQAEKEFVRCLELTASEESYLGGVLVLGGQVQTKLVYSWPKIVLFTVIGAVVFVSALVYLIEHGPYNIPAVTRLNRFVDEHGSWLLNPAGWFQSYSGYVFMGLVLAYAIYVWPRIIRDYLRNRK